MTAAMQPRDAQAVLRRRAEALARPPQAASQRAYVQVVEFSLAGTDCALELAWLREVRPLRGATLLPRASAGVLGVTHVRGRMLPLLDISGWLGLPPMDDLPEGGHVMVAGTDAPVFTFCVAALHGLAMVLPVDIAHRTAPLSPVRPRAVQGVTASGRLLLDGAVLLDSHRRNLEAGRSHPDIHRGDPPICSTT